MTREQIEALTRPIIGIENRTAQEAFDIMADRIKSALALKALDAEGTGVADAATVRDYEEAMTSHLAHVRDLDVAMNGEDGAAKRPLLIDIKAQLLEAIAVAALARPASPEVKAEPVALTAYEMQVLIGTSISGCAMNVSRTFDLPAAWLRLHELGLIYRADGLACPTPAGEARISAALASPPADSGGLRKVLDDIAELAIPNTANPDVLLDAIHKLAVAALKGAPDAQD